MSSELQVITPMVWICTTILMVMDGILILFARRYISRQEFQHLRRNLVIAAGIFFLLVWSSMMIWAWDWFYSYIFPSQLRLPLPVVFCLGYSLLAFGMGWLSLKLPGNPAVNWCLLGGLEGFLSHLFAIFVLGAASKPPIMQGTSLISVLIFAIFEKAFYWSLILFVCWSFGRFVQRKVLEA